MLGRRQWYQNLITNKQNVNVVFSYGFKYSKDIIKINGFRYFI